MVVTNGVFGFGEKEDCDETGWCPCHYVYIFPEPFTP
jgi:hypothetical protein